VSRTFSAAIGLLMLVCGACSPHTSTTSDQDPLLDVIALDLVTDSGGYPARKHVLDLAEEELVKQCMTARGHIYQPFVPPLLAGSDEERMVDLPRRRTEGYGLAPDQPPPPNPAPNANEPDYQQALFGDDQHHQEHSLPNGSRHSYPTTGCVAESRAALYGDTQRWARTVMNPQIYNNTILARVENAPELRDATARWASCMAAAGHHHITPEAARNATVAAYDRHGSTQPVRQQEITTAVADGECALSADVPLTELRLRRAGTQTLPADQRLDIAELATVHCAAHHTAKRVIPHGKAADC
jgi:hypothetical protein